MQSITFNDDIKYMSEHILVDEKCFVICQFFMDWIQLIVLSPGVRNRAAYSFALS